MTCWINVYDEQELEYWTNRLRVTREELLHAVNEVGANPAEVRKRLRKL